MLKLYSKNNSFGSVTVLQEWTPIPTASSSTFQLIDRLVLSFFFLQSAFLVLRTALPLVIWIKTQEKA